MIRARRALLLPLAILFLGIPEARAQFEPGAGGNREQQEITTGLLLGPESTVLGAFLGGGAVYLVERGCCTKSGDTPAVAPEAAGAAVGATIATTWAIWSVCSHFHDGSKRNAALGAFVGSAVGAAVYFGGPGATVESGQDQLYRALTFLFLPTVTSLLGWHIESGAFFEAGHAAPVSPTAYALGFPEKRPPPLATAISIRF